MKIKFNYVGLEGKLVYSRNLGTHKTYKIGPFVIKVYK